MSVGVNVQYVYQSFEPGVWTVGFYAPNGEWIAESDHESRKEAASRVHFLNGGELAYTKDAEKK